MKKEYIYISVFVFCVSGFILHFFVKGEYVALLAAYIVAIVIFFRD